VLLTAAISATRRGPHHHYLIFTDPIMLAAVYAEPSTGVKLARTVVIPFRQDQGVFHRYVACPAFTAIPFTVLDLPFAVNDSVTVPSAAAEKTTR